MLGPPVRLVATDVDGTFQNNAHEVPEANKDVARKCTAASIPVVLCTGKVPGPWSERMLAELSLDTYSIYYNGGLIIDRDGATFYEAVLPDAVVDGVLGALESMDRRVTIIVYSIAGRDHKYQQFTNEGPDESVVVEWIAGAGEHPPVKIEPSADGMPGSMQSFVRAHALPVSKVFVSTRAAPSSTKVEPGPTNWADYDQLLATMQQTAGDSAVCLEQRRHTLPGLDGISTIELMPPGQDKSSALKRVLEVLDLPPSALMTLGDGMNDLGMLQLAGTSVAMANAVPQAKEVAGHVSEKTNDEAGWAEIVEQLALRPAAAPGGSGL
jgi:hydroxymethylpyrimidine pyrophosphatase-like HAD family hydrolase